MLKKQQGLLLPRLQRLHRGLLFWNSAIKSDTHHDGADPDAALSAVIFKKHARMWVRKWSSVSSRWNISPSIGADEDVPRGHVKLRIAGCCQGASVCVPLTCYYCVGSDKADKENRSFIHLFMCFASWKKRMMKLKFCELSKQLGSTCVRCTGWIYRCMTSQGQKAVTFMKWKGSYLLLFCK